MPTTAAIIPYGMPVVVDHTHTQTMLNSLSDLAVPEGAEYGRQESPGATVPDTLLASADYHTFTLNRIGLAYAYKTFGLVEALCSTPVNDAFRGGIKIMIPEISSFEDLAKLNKAIEEGGDWDIAKSVAIWDRLFGGAGLITVTDQDPSTPLDMDKITGKALRFLDADRWELILSGMMMSGGYGNGTAELTKLEIARTSYGYACAGQYNYYGVPLDSSRVIKVTGRKAPSIIRQRLQGWGLSVLEQCIREIQTYLKFQNMLYELVDEAKIDVHRIEGFNDLLGTPEGTTLVKLRINLANWIKNYKNALVMDKLDEFEQKQISFSGLADILVEFRINLCASLKIPYNKLFGQSATGFSSGQDSMENYNAMIEVEIRDRIRQVIRKIIELRCQQVFGYVPEFTFAFAPLRVLNATEEEDVLTKKQNRVAQLRTMDQITGLEADTILHKDGLLSIETEVGQGLREPMPEGSEPEMNEDGKKPGPPPKKKEEKEKQNSLAMIRELISTDRRRHSDSHTWK